jgi:hypothetical protein
MTFKKDYRKKRNKAREGAEEKKNKQATSEQEKKQASNQQASRVSSTVDHGPGTADPQA